MKIYTRKGDKGETSLIGGTRVTKGHIRIDSYGNVDELNAQIGLVQSCLGKEDVMYGLLSEVMDDLFVMGSLLAADPGKNRMKLPKLAPSDVEKLEGAIDQMNETLAPLRAFIMPAGHEDISRCHVARTVCRRAERSVVRLWDVYEEDEAPDGVILEYLNRLSDFLFVLARKIAQDLGVDEVEWKPRDSN